MSIKMLVNCGNKTLLYIELSKIQKKLLILIKNSIYRVIEDIVVFTSSFS